MKPDGQTLARRKADLAILIPLAQRVRKACGGHSRLDGGSILSIAY